jgi:hypothetical protein
VDEIIWHKKLDPAAMDGLAAMEIVVNVTKIE